MVIKIIIGCDALITFESTVEQIHFLATCQVDFNVAEDLIKLAKIGFKFDSDFIKFDYWSSFVLKSTFKKIRT